MAELETLILVDGKVVDMTHNDIHHSCADAGVEVYNVYTLIELEDCSVQKVGFRVGEEDIETEVRDQ